MRSDGMCASVERVGQCYCENAVPSFKTHGNQAKLNKNWNIVNGHCKKADKYNESTDLFEPV